MKLWLDDMRNPKDWSTWKTNPEDKSNDWIWVKTYEEAVELLETGQVTHVSLDHDLGTEKTGYDVICWMEEKLHANELIPFNVIITVHSANPVGRKKIQMAIESMQYFSQGKENDKEGAGD